ncbi:hypothetical protein ACQCR9_13865, partial [Ralstonia pseudosolanacearum]
IVDRVRAGLSVSSDRNLADLAILRPDADLAEAACDADLSRERIGALREATYPATPAPNPAAAPAKP